MHPIPMEQYIDSRPYQMDTMDMEVDADKSKPWLEITEQPTDKFRFRYLSEMHGTHGSLTGRNSQTSKKTYPSVRLYGYNQSAIIRCSLYQNNKKSLHSHSLVIRHGDEDKNDPHDVHVSPGQYEAVYANKKIFFLFESINQLFCCILFRFRGMGIIQTAKKFMDSELLQKLTSRLEFEENRQITDLECEKV